MIAKMAALFKNIVYHNFKQMSSKIASRLFSDSCSINHVLVNKQKNLRLIGINRPEKRNCIDDETAAQLRKAFEDFEDDSEAYVAVLYGEGGNFCAGYDLSEIAKGNFSGISSDHGPVGPTKQLLSKPVVAAISGYAVAGGFELALWCDIRVVEETAVMGCFERRFGMPLVNGSTARLPHIVGLSRALDFILTGRPIHAHEAYQCGIASKVTACGTALDNAINIANSLCKFPQECLRADRRSAYHSMYNSQSLKEALKFEYENAVHVLGKEPVKGAEKFLHGTGRHGTFNLDPKEDNVLK